MGMIAVLTHKEAAPNPGPGSDLGPLGGPGATEDRSERA
jgi:hypothetical protein